MIERFEDVIAWQKARILTRKIYEITRKGKFAKDFGLAKQIQRAAVSIMANITEGFERGGRSEFHQFLSTAKASCAEVRSHCMLLLMSVTWIKAYSKSFSPSQRKSVESLAA